MDEFRWLQGQHESESEQSQLHVHQYPSRLSSGWALHLEGALNSPLYGGDGMQDEPMLDAG
jgi:hypothetical protein